MLRQIGILRICGTLIPLTVCFGQQGGKPAPPKSPQAPLIQPLPGPPAPIYPASPPEQKKFVIEYVWNYQYREYKPPVTITAVERSTSSYDTPEQAFTALISAMMTGDYNWWFNSFTETSQKKRKEIDKEQNLTEQQWTQSWKQMLPGRRVQLENRTETGGYVLLGYTLRSIPEDKVVYRSAISFKKENNKWLDSMDLATDEFFQRYGEGEGDKITRVVR